MLPPNGPMVFNTSQGWLARSNRAKEKIAKARDPQTLIVRSVRAGMVAIETAGEDAARDFAAMHAPVASPLPQAVHPQVAERVRAFLDEAGIIDVLLPIEGETLAEMTKRYQAKAKAAHDEAVSQLRAHEVAKARAVLDEAAAKLAAVESVCTDGEAPGDEAILDLDDEEDAVPVLPVARGRGRPRLTDEA